MKRSISRAGLVAVLGCLVLVTPPLPVSRAARPEPCPVDTGAADVAVDCYAVRVPENRRRPSAGAVWLQVMVIHSRADRPSPDPVVYLEGGPGGAPIPTFEDFLDSPILDSRDLILVDQRGTGYSTPYLGCDELYSIPFDADDTAYDTALEACRSRLTAAGVDVSAYTTVAAADDLEDVRTELGIDRWNVYGVSYGTRLALAYLERHPAPVRAAVLDSVLPRQVDLVRAFETGDEIAVDTLVTRCEEDESCRAAAPDLRSSLDELRSRLRRSPAVVDVPFLDGTDQTYQDQVDEDTLLWMLDQAMYDSSLIPLLPGLIERMDAGGTTDLGRLLGLIGYQGPDLSTSDGVYYSVLCHDEYPFTDEGPDDPLGFDPSCRIWNVGSAPASENDPVVSDVPTLLLAGGLDPVTPPDWARLAATTLSHGYVLEIASGGHGVSFDPCGSQAMVDFLDDPTGTPDASCRTDPPRWASHRVPVDGMGFANGLWNETGGLLMVAVAWSLIAVLGVASWALRRRIGGGAHHLWWLLALACFVLFTVFGSMVIFAGVFVSTSNAYLFSFPTWTWPIFALPWLGLGMTVMAGGLTLSSVARRRTPWWALFPYGALGMLVAALFVGYALTGAIPGL